MPRRKVNITRIASLLTRDETPPAMPSAHVTPAFLTSTYLYEDVEKTQRTFRGEEVSYVYSRWSHPNAEEVERKLEALETYGTDLKARALVFASGMAAISSAIQALAAPGDTILAQGNIYGTTVDYFQYLSARYGVRVIYEDFTDPSKIESALHKHRHRISIVYLETPSNPTVRCCDIRQLCALTRKYGAVSIVDNTFATSYLQQPLRLGADVVVYSGTKYLNGHGTGLSGALVGQSDKWMADIAKIRKLTGCIASPFDCWLLNNGLKTLHLRMERHSDNALFVARTLLKLPAVKKVYYPGLPEDISYNIAKKQMYKYGGVLAFEVVGGYQRAMRVLKRVRHCRVTASLGVTDTLIQHPASMSHYFVPEDQRLRYHIHDGLLRLSVGIDDPQDVTDDLIRALGE
ncbi:MAG: aminotransferase class I/II-fold pyridoxal phosphate-dependent enzyme [Chitinophagales bacterium]|nr:aminotransferase class I/II-fold pyridoxal phosphate-dependent enzyme [Chitinophagales bacterium]MDW8418503.1 aminotransferase class I/II-fold pyridoxal phosphate-dependent enzyme [Chitinophagales bacterium]